MWFISLFLFSLLICNLRSPIHHIWIQLNRLSSVLTWPLHAPTQNGALPKLFTCECSLLGLVSARYLLRWVPYWKGFVCWIEIFGFAGFGSRLKNPMFLPNKSLMSYIGLYHKFLYKISSLLLTPLPPAPRWSFFSNLPWCANGYVWAKEHSVLCSSKLCARLQWSVSIFQTLCRHSDWMISVCHINPKWHAGAFHTKPFSFLLRLFMGRHSSVPRGLW